MHKTLSPFSSVLCRHLHNKTLSAFPSRFSPSLLRRSFTTSSPSSPSHSCSSDSKANEPPSLPLPSLIRSLVELRKSGTFSTIVVHSEKVSGPQVFGTPFMPYILTGNGTPIIALQPYSEHISHLEGYGDASLVMYPLTPAKIAPASVGLFRVNLTGEMTKMPKEIYEEMLTQFCAVHPAARIHGPYEFYTLMVKNVYYYARGLTDMISVGEYEGAEIDQVTVNSKKIIDKLNNINSQHALILMCKDYGNFTASEVVAYWADKYGFNVVAKNEENQWTDVRFPFPYVMKGVDDCMNSIENSLDHIVDKYAIKPK